jgi:L-threonylcarbamoyladenylate synthase
MEIEKIKAKNPQYKKIEKAAAILKRGGIVAFPTDTVYGIGVNALDQKAVTKIYKIKKRNRNKPLIIMIAAKNDAEKYAYLTVKSKRLIAKFWPGPLTLVLKTKKSIPKYLTKDGTIGLRMPKNRIFISLARACKFTLATTSANFSGEKSTTSAQEVAEKLRRKVDLIIDGGRAKIGVGSTVIDMTSTKPKILRQGVITLNDIKKIL